MAQSSTVSMWQRSMASLQSDFVEAVSIDTGRSEAESYLYDWLPVESTLDFLKNNIENFANPRSLSSGLPTLLGRRQLIERRLPMGEVLVVGTWNFPLSLHLSQIFFAAACGNKITFKSSPYTSQVSKLFEKELPRLLGQDNFKIWSGSDEDCLKAVEEGRFQALIFTGGTAVAKLYAKAAAQSFTKCVLEASGSEALVAHPSHWNESQTSAKSLDHWLWALMHFNGQTCVAPRFWFVPKSRLNETWSSLQEILKSESSEKVMATRAPLRHEGVQKEFADWVAFMAKLPEAEVWKPSSQFPCAFVKLKDVKNLPPETPSSFGPGAVLIGYENISECVSWIKKSPWSLMTQVYGDDFTNQEWESLQQIETSIVSLGESIVAVGDPAVSFGGHGASGQGVTHGIDGLRELTRNQVFVEFKAWPLTPEWMQPRWTSLNELKRLVPLLQSMKTHPLKSGWSGLKSFFENR